MKVVPLNAPEAGTVKRLGFMAGHIEMPDDFDTMGQKRVLDLVEKLEWNADDDYKSERTRR